MKIGKYPVKHTYSIARMVADVFSVGLAILIVSGTLNFFDTYAKVVEYLGYGSGGNIATIINNYDSAFLWKQWLALIFPALTAAVFAAYIVLTLKSHKMKGFNLTKLTAQKCYDIYAFCVSLCKIPALLAIFDAMYITHQVMLGNTENLFSVQILCDAVLIAIIIRLCMHRIRALEHSAREDDVIDKSEHVKVKIRHVDSEEED